ncbi:peptide deformylase [Candidatus Azambacteria bacterium]|nr:peptide deformylase [Candidatus Azambacteria bacterium]MBI3685238.1 peptide deformylase [Candidatus Azambacteria bacterium]
MTILTIETELKGKNKILRATSKEVKDIKSPGVQKLVRDMHKTLAATEHGIGLAAPQVGANVRIFVASPALGLNQTVFINPIILKISNKTEQIEEGCLSLPGLYGKIARATSLKVQAQNQNGRIFKMKAEGLIAQLIQHEIGHLDGELFKDKAQELFPVNKEKK